MFGPIYRRGAIAICRSLPRTAIYNSSIASSRHLIRTINPQSSITRTLTTSLARRQQAQYAEASSAADGSAGTEDAGTVLPTEDEGPATTFQQLGERKHVHRNLLRSVIEDMGLTTMYPVQQETLNAALTGRDIIAQARTGTGKTLAFLLPIMQHIIKENPQLAYRDRKRVYPNDIRGIIISPTRELAEQIANEANKIAKHTGIVVQLAVGGTQKNLMLRKTQHEGCHLLVGTPGRLKDILSDQGTGIAAPQLATFVLDEADRLLDQGFLPEIEEIKRLVPDLLEGNRQTMMMSATISHDVVDLVRNTLQPGFKFVQCVDPNEAPTHDRIPQKVVVAPGMENIYPALYELFQREVLAWKAGTARPLKALVFFNSGFETISAARVFASLVRSHPDFRFTNVSQIHSKLTQAQRTYASDRFRRAESAILMSTDVTARGLDFPDVTHVIQVGLPTHGGRESYIHRIGRTGRAGKEGEGWLLISRMEQRKGEEMLGDLPLKPDSSLKLAQVNMQQLSEQPAEIVDKIQQVKDAFSTVSAEDLTNTYRSYLGTLAAYNSQEVVDNMNRMATIGWGLSEPPSISMSLATKLGYSRCRGLNTSNSFSAPRSSFGSGGSFGRGSFGSDSSGDSFGNSFGGSDRGERSFGGGERRGSYGGGGNTRFGSSRFGGDRDRRGSYGGDRSRQSYGNDRGGSSGPRRADFGA